MAITSTRKFGKNHPIPYICTSLIINLLEAGTATSNSKQDLRDQRPESDAR